MSRKRNLGSEKSHTPEDNKKKDKGTRKTNTLGLQIPANDDEWEVALQPSQFINEENIPTTSQEEQQEKLWHPPEVATMTISVEKVDASMQTDPMTDPRRRPTKKEEKSALSHLEEGNSGPSRLKNPKTITQVDTMVDADPLTAQKRAETQPVRIILVSAPPIMVDVGTDNPKLRSRKKASVSVSPAPSPVSAPSPRPDNDISSESDIEDDNRGDSLYKSSTEEYEGDVYEPMTTKVTKIYKKRPDRELPIESDETFDDQPNTQFDSRRQSATPIKTPTLYGETDIPRSGDTSVVGRDLFPKASSSSSELFSSSGSVYRLYASRENPSLPEGGMTAFSLSSGRAFIYMVIPPDGGYGWIILVLSFLAQLIVDGIVFSIGILLPCVSHEFNVSNTQIAFVASIQIGCYFLGGAFSSALINSYGFRPVAIAGVLISALTILIASFSTNFWMMLIFYSLLGGPSLSMIWVSSQLIIGYYFERYRPIANGFSCSGAGAGIVIFSVLNNILTVEVGWRYTLRVQVMIILLILFMVMAYLEVPPTQVGIVHRPEYSSSSDEYYGNFYVHNFLREEEPRKSLTTIEAYEPPTGTRRSRFWNKCHSLCFRKKKRRSTESTEYSKSISVRASERNFVVRPDPLQKEDLFYTGPVEYDEPHTREHLNGKELELVGSEKYIQRAAYALHNIHNDTDEKAPSPGIFYTDTSSQKPPPDMRKRRFHSKIFRALGRLFAVHLFSIFEFRWLVASAFLYPLGFNIPFVYSKERAEIPPKYAILIGPAIGLSNFIVRIACGFLAYKIKSWTTFICGGGMVFGGFAVFLSAFVGQTSIAFQLLFGISYGVAPAVYSSLRALIYVRYLGLSNLTNAFGLSALAMGLGVFLGTSVAGLLVDQGGYVSAFAMAGLCIMLSGLIKLLLPIIVKCRNRRLARIGRPR